MCVPAFQIARECVIFYVKMQITHKNWPWNAIPLEKNKSSQSVVWYNHVYHVGGDPNSFFSRVVSFFRSNYSNYPTKLQKWGWDDNDGGGVLV